MKWHLRVIISDNPKKMDVVKEFSNELLNQTPHLCREYSLGKSYEYSRKKLLTSMTELFLRLNSKYNLEDQLVSKPNIEPLRPEGRRFLYHRT